MKKKKEVVKENYLERIPKRPDKFDFTVDEEGIVTLNIENKGVFNRIAQKLLKKPKVSYIHLDEMGSFIWPLMDGEKDITAIGKFVEEKFGEEANPLYERLAKYFQILDSYGFVEWVNKVDEQFEKGCQEWHPFFVLTKRMSNCVEKCRNIQKNLDIRKYPLELL